MLKKETILAVGIPNGKIQVFKNDVLDKEIQIPECTGQITELCQFGDFVYFQNIFDGNKLYKLNIETGESSLMNEVSSSYPCTDGTNVYFQNGSDGYKLYKVNIETNVTTKMNEIRSYYSCTDGSFIYFANSSDGYKLYKTNIETNVTTKMNEVNSQNLCTDGSFIYFANGSDGYKLSKVNIETNVTTKMNEIRSYYLCTDGTFVYFTNYSDGGKLYKINIETNVTTKMNEVQPANLCTDGVNVYFRNTADNKLYKTNIDTNVTTKMNEVSSRPSKAPITKEYNQSDIIKINNNIKLTSRDSVQHTQIGLLNTVQISDIPTKLTYKIVKSDDKSVIEEKTVDLATTQYTFEKATQDLLQKNVKYELVVKGESDDVYSEPVYFECNGKQLDKIAVLGRVDYITVMKNDVFYKNIALTGSHSNLCVYGDKIYTQIGTTKLWTIDIETEIMSSRDINSTYLCTDGINVYFRNGSDDGKLYKININTNEMTKINDINSSYLCTDGIFVYFVDGSNGNKLYKINIKTNIVTKMNDFYSPFICMDGINVYCANHFDDGKLYKTNIQTNVTTKMNEVGVSYICTDGVNVYFINGSDDNKLYKTNIKTNETIKMNEVKSYIPCTDGINVYFQNSSDNQLPYRISVNGGDIEKIITIPEITTAFSKGDFAEVQQVPPSKPLISKINDVETTTIKEEPQIIQELTNMEYTYKGGSDLTKIKIKILNADDESVIIEKEVETNELVYVFDKEILDLIKKRVNYKVQISEFDTDGMESVYSDFVYFRLDLKSVRVAGACLEYASGSDYKVGVWVNDVVKYIDGIQGQQCCTDGVNVYFDNTSDNSYLYKTNIKTNVTTKMNEVKSNYSCTDGSFVYFSNGSDGNKLYKTNIKTNVTTKMNEISPTYLCTDGTFVYFMNASDGRKLYKTNIETNVTTKMNDVNSNHLCTDGSFVYFANYSDNFCLYKINIKTNEMTKMNKAHPSSLCTDGSFVYFANGSDGDKLYKTNIATNITTKMNDVHSPYSCTDGVFVYFMNTSDNSYLYKTNIKTNVTTKISDKKIYSQSTFAGVFTEKSIPNKPTIKTINTSTEITDIDNPLSIQYTEPLTFTWTYSDDWNFLQKSVLFDVYNETDSIQVTTDYEVVTDKQTATVNTTDLQLDYEKKYSIKIKTKNTDGGTSVVSDATYILTSQTPPSKPVITKLNDEVVSKVQAEPTYLRKLVDMDYTHVSEHNLKAIKIQILNADNNEVIVDKIMQTTELKLVFDEEIVGLIKRRVNYKIGIIQIDTDVDNVSGYGVESVISDWVYFRLDKKSVRVAGACTKISTDTYSLKIVVNGEIKSINAIKAFYTCTDGTNIYFRNDSDGNKLYKINIETGEITKMNDINSNKMCTDGINVYFSNSSDNSFLYKTNIETGVSSKVNDANFQYPCTDGVNVYFSNFNDGRKLYKTNIKANTTTKMNDAGSYHLCTDGINVYFMNSSDNNFLYKTNIETGVTTKMNDVGGSYLCTDGVNVYFCNVSDGRKLYKINIKTNVTTKMNEETSNNNRTDGINIYYSDGVYKLKQIKIDTNQVTSFVDGDIYGESTFAGNFTEKSIPEKSVIKTINTSTEIKDKLNPLQVQYDQPITLTWSYEDVDEYNQKAILISVYDETNSKEIVTDLEKFIDVQEITVTSTELKLESNTDYSIRIKAKNTEDGVGAISEPAYVLTSHQAPTKPVVIKYNELVSSTDESNPLEFDALPTITWEYASVDGDAQKSVFIKIVDISDSSVIVDFTEYEIANQTFKLLESYGLVSTKTYKLYVKVKSAVDLISEISNPTYFKLRNQPPNKPNMITVNDKSPSYDVANPIEVNFESDIKLVWGYKDPDEDTQKAILYSVYNETDKVEVETDTRKDITVQEYIIPHAEFKSSKVYSISLKVIDTNDKVSDSSDKTYIKVPNQSPHKPNILSIDSIATSTVKATPTTAELEPTFVWDYLDIEEDAQKSVIFDFYNETDSKEIITNLEIETVEQTLKLIRDKVKLPTVKTIRVNIKVKDINDKVSELSKNVYFKIPNQKPNKPVLLTVDSKLVSTDLASPTETISTPVITWNYTDIDEHIQQNIILDIWNVSDDKLVISDYVQSLTEQSYRIPESIILKTAKVYKIELRVEDSEGEMSEKSNAIYIKIANVAPLTPSILLINGETPATTVLTAQDIGRAFTIKWSYEDADGNAQKSAIFKVFNETDNVLVNDNYIVNQSTQEKFISDLPLLPNKVYSMNVKVVDEFNGMSDISQPVYVNTNGIIPPAIGLSVDSQELLAKQPSISFKPTKGLEDMLQHFRINMDEYSYNDISKEYDIKVGETVVIESKDVQTNWKVLQNGIWNEIPSTGIKATQCSKVKYNFDKNFVINNRYVFTVQSYDIADSIYNNISNIVDFVLLKNPLLYSIGIDCVEKPKAISELYILQENVEGILVNAYATNNGNDEAPVWEDVTEIINNNKNPHIFENEAKDSENWEVKVKVMLTIPEGFENEFGINIQKFGIQM